MRRFKRNSKKPVTSLSEIHKMTKMASKKSGIPISITTDMGYGEKNNEITGLDGIAGRRISDKKLVVRIHPIMQYKTKRTIRDTIGHELDHIKVMKKQKI